MILDYDEVGIEFEFRDSGDLYLKADHVQASLGTCLMLEWVDKEGFISYTDLLNQVKESSQGLAVSVRDIQQLAVWQRDRAKATALPPKAKADAEIKIEAEIDYANYMKFKPSARRDILLRALHVGPLNVDEFVLKAGGEACRKTLFNDLARLGGKVERVIAYRLLP